MREREGGGGAETETLSGRVREREAGIDKYRDTLRQGFGGAGGE